MSYINRDQAGNITGVFACQQTPEQEFLNEAELYSAPTTPIQQIRALEQAHDDDQRKLNRQAAIDTALTVACRSPAAAGMTHDQVHASECAALRYRAMVDLEAQYGALRKQIV